MDRVEELEKRVRKLEKRVEELEALLEGSALAKRLAEAKSRLKDVEEYSRRLREKIKKLEEDPPSRRELLLAENIKKVLDLGASLNDGDEEFARLGWVLREAPLFRLAVDAFNALFYRRLAKEAFSKGDEEAGKNYQRAFEKSMEVLRKDFEESEYEGLFPAVKTVEEVEGELKQVLYGLFLKLSEAQKGKG